MSESAMDQGGGGGFDPDLEARLVALILGEASEFEVEALENLMARRPEVAKLKRDLEAMHGLVEAAAAIAQRDDGEWKLAPGRRAHVMETLGIGNGTNGPDERPNGNGNGDGNGERQEARIHRAGVRVMWAAAACLMINLILFAWLVTKNARSGKEDSGMLSTTGGERPMIMMMRDSSEPEPAANAPGESESRGVLPPASGLRLKPRALEGQVALNAKIESGGEEAQEALKALKEKLAKLGPAVDAPASPGPDPFGEPAPENEPTPLQELADRGNDAEAAGEGEAGDRFGGGGGNIKRERAARGEKKKEADELLTEGREAYAKGDYEKAVQNYNQALSTLPGGAETEARKRVIEQHLADGSVALSQQFRRLGRYDEAREKLEGVLKIDPENQHAHRELDYLDDPIRTNPGLTYEHTQQIDKVRRHLYTAEGYKNLGLYDEAIREYQETLRTDPHNSAARRGMESIHKLKSDHYRSAYDETRARLLAEVDEEWEKAVPPPPRKPADDPTLGGRLRHNLVGRPNRNTADPLTQKMKDTVIEELNFDDTTVEEAVDYLRQIAKEKDGSKAGINFVIRKPRLEGGAELLDEELDAEGGLGAVDPGTARVKELKLKNVTVEEALKHIADQARLRYKVDEYAVTLLPLGSGEGDDVLTRKWRVGRNFLADLEAGAETGEADPFGGDDTGLGGGSLKPRRPMVDILKDAGIDFPPGSSAQFIPSTGTLIVSNTPANLDLMDQLAEGSIGSAPEIDYEKFDSLLRRAGSEARPDPAVAAIEHKVKNIVLPTIDFDDVTVEEAVAFLEQRARELDTMDLDPFRNGVSFHIAKPRLTDDSLDAELDAEGGLGAVDPARARVKELRLRNVPLATVLQYICDQARLRYKIDEQGITLLPLTATEGDDIVTRSWEVHPDVMKKIRSYDDYGDPNEPDPFVDEEPMTEEEIAETRQALADRPLEDLLKDAGIDFPPGAMVRYDATTGVLLAANTPGNHDLIDQLLESIALDMSQASLAKEALEKNAREEAFSTFSLHVSDVSFKLAKATLEKGEWPAPGQVRVEEFVNAFEYGDPTPRMEEKVACRIEQAIHPFMQQRNLMRISMRTAALGRAGGTPLRLTVLLDNSGSMERADRAESVQRAFELLTAQLNAGDVITLIGFARTPRLLADRVRGHEAGHLAKLVALTPSEGGTNLEEALRLGLAKAREQKVAGGLNRIILLTDGAANLGNARPEDLASLVETMREDGIAFDACGVGAEGLNDEILESLTRKGDGRYYFLDRPEDADAGFARQIAGALRPAARNVKVQVEFNRARVGYYKLYGFDKHRLEKEDFRDDTVDAAEMAAEEAGNAIYHVQVLPDGEGDIGSVSVRFQDMATGVMVERRWTIPFESDAARLGEATPSMRLAGTAALFGEKLDGSPIGERVRMPELVRLVNPLASDFPTSERVRELIEMVAKARELGGGE